MALINKNFTVQIKQKSILDTVNDFFAQQKISPIHWCITERKNDELTICTTLIE